MDQASRLRNIIKQQKKEDIVRKSARVITVTSGKGGVGKTNVSVNLAVQLRKKGNRVIILDADLGLANIEVLFGVLPKYNLSDLIFNGKDIQDILTTGPLGIEFISGGTGIQELTELTREQLYYLIQKLGEIDYNTDIIIIDTGAGISKTVMEFVMASKEVLLIITPEPTSMTDSYAVLKTLKKTAPNIDDISVNILTNRVASKKEGDDIFSKFNLVVEKYLDIKLNHIGYIPNDNLVQKAVCEQKPFSIVYPSSQASIAIEKISSKLLDHNIDDTSKNGITQFFSNLIKLKFFK